jgi:tRNA (guanine-N7-)-methyltransferase
MVEKVFRRFDDTGDEKVIGGLGRHRQSYLPPGLEGRPRLVVPSIPATVEAFHGAAAGRPVVLEVGPGKGRFLNGMAVARPGAVCLGVEIRLSFALSVLARADKAGHPDVWAAWGDARFVVPALLAPGTVSEAFLLFPDPWWKRRHAARRHGPAMAGVIADALVPGGRLVLKSDVPEYLATLVESFRSTGRYDDAPVPDDLPLTDRERRLRETGTNVFAAALTRR